MVVRWGLWQRHETGAQQPAWDDGQKMTLWDSLEGELTPNFYSS